jgi:hypothetical protein
VHSPPSASSPSRKIRRCCVDPLNSPPKADIDRRPLNVRYYGRWEGDMRAFLIASALALGACASHSSAYTRTDGVPVDPLHQQATLAQCKGEGAAAVQSTGGAYEALDRARKEAAVVNACMARNGYIQAQQ